MPLTEKDCPACNAPCIYKYTHERARSAEFMGNDQEFLDGYKAHEKRLTVVGVK